MMYILRNEKFTSLRTDTVTHYTKLQFNLFLKQVLFAGVPGAGGHDACYTLLLGPSARRRVEVLWGNFSGKGGVGKCWGVGPGKGKGKDGGGGGAEELRAASNVMGKIFAATGIEGKKGGEEGTEEGGTAGAEKAAKAEEEAEKEKEEEEEEVLTAVCPLLSAQSMDGAAGDGLNGSYVSVGVCVHADLTPEDLLIG